jgi:hypothetical protein
MSNIAGILSLFLIAAAFATSCEPVAKTQQSVLILPSTE